MATKQSAKNTGQPTQVLSGPAKIPLSVLTPPTIAVMKAKCAAEKSARQRCIWNTENAVCPTPATNCSTRTTGTMPANLGLKIASPK